MTRIFLTALIALFVVAAPRLGAQAQKPEGPVAQLKVPPKVKAAPARSTAAKPATGKTARAVTPPAPPAKQKGAAVARAAGGTKPPDMHKPPKAAPKR